MRKLVLIFLCLLLTACTIPLGEDSSNEDLNDQAATLVAMTLSAINTPTQENTPLPTPTRVVTKETGTPTPTITPTYSVPMLRINEPTNCRTGPGQTYDILFTLNAGATVEIIGQYPENNFWAVKMQGREEPCWAWGEYATVSGSDWTVPTLNAPATVTPSPPPAPGIANWEYLCGYSGSGPNVTVTLEWTDRASDENGYRIYRNGERITELPPNSNSYSEVVDVDSGENMTYLIEVFNSAGASSSSPIKFSCQ